MDSEFEDLFFEALRNKVTEYRDDIPILEPEEVVEVFEQIKGSKMEAEDVPILAGAYIYVGISSTDVDCFWSEWYEERENPDGAS